MKKLLILTVAALSAVSVTAQEEALVAQILKNNPDLEVARLNKEADSLSARSENNLADPEVEVEYMPKAGTMEMTVKESFEWPGAYMTRRKAIEHNISAFEYLYESQKIEAVKQARLAYLDLVRLNRSIKRQGKILAMIEKIVNNTALLEVRDEMTVITIGKLRIEAFDLASQIRQMKIERNVVLESLRIMNGGKPVEIDTETCEFNAELKDAKRNLPRALILGSFIVVATYILYYIGLNGTVTTEELMASGEAAAKMAFQRLLGPVGGVAVFALIVVSVIVLGFL